MLSLNCYENHHKKCIAPKWCNCECHKKDRLDKKEANKLKKGNKNDKTN